MYRRIGYAEAPLFPVLLNAVRKLMGVTDDDMWRAKINDPDSVTDRDRATIRENLELELDSMVSPYGSFYFTDSSQICSLPSPLRYFIADFMKTSNRIGDPQNIPVRLKRYDSHLLSFNEIADDYLLSKIDYMLLPGSREGKRIPLKRDLVISHLVQAALSILDAEGYRELLRSIMAKQAGNIMYKIYQRGELNQFEKTYIANLLTPDFGLNVPLFMGSTPKFSADSEYEFADLEKTLNSYLPGPYSKVTGIVSTGGLVAPLLYVGPYTPTIMLAQGRIVPFFNVHTLHVSITKQFSWTTENLLKYQLATSQSQGTLRIEKENLAIGATKIGNTPPLDEPDVRWEHTKYGDIHFRPKYQSTIFGRELVAESSDPYWIERYGLQATQQGSAIGLQSIDQFRVVDIELLKKDSNGNDLNRPYLKRVEREATFLCIQKQAGKASYVSKTINLRPVFPEGPLFIKPVVSDAYVVDVSDLYTPSPEFLGVFQQQSGLSSDEMALSSAMLSVQFNAYQYRELLGLEQNIVKEANAIDFAKRISPLNNII